MGLSVKKVQALLRKGVPGKHTDGANGGGVKGLMLVVEHKTSAYYVLRWQRNHKIRHMGLGSARDLPLVSAREKARELRERIALGTDPLELKRADREAQRQAEAKRLTFKQAAERCHEAAAPGWSNDAHAGEFLASLERWVHPHIGSLDVAAVDKDTILKVLEQPIRGRIGRVEGGGTFWTAKTITADRTRQRIERILDWAEARGFRPAGVPNPARWKNYLDQLLAPPRAIMPVRNLAAVPFAEVPGMMIALAADQSAAAQCLRFITLTAARLSEALKATWDEIDLTAQEWRVPATRMKRRKPHVVPLAPQAIELLKGLYREETNPHLFISPRAPGIHIAASAIGDALRRVGRRETVHGMRSAFSTWAAERTSFPGIIAELCLHHTIGNAVEAAYKRTDLIDKRRKLMTAWAKYCCTPPAADAGTVLPMRGRI
jgi:integrase